MATPTILVVEQEKLDNELKRVIKEAYDEASNDETFFVGVSGGSLPPMLIRVLKQMEGIDWKKWLFFFCDERCVSSSSEDSTFGAYKRLLETPDEKLPLCLSQFVSIDPSLKPSKIAEDYLSKVRQRFDNASNLPRFHLLLLGLGPDGHTCSLFPNHRLLKENTKWISFITDSPKPPPERITMTFPILNNAKYCVFVTTGEGKAQVIKEILEDKKPYPAGLVQPHSGKLIWLMDTGAGSKLKRALIMSGQMDEARVLKTIEDQIGLFPDFPKPGILFRDVMPILGNPSLFMDMIKLLSCKVAQFEPDVVLGIEARGFLIGPSIAHELKVPFVPIRKKGKLPGELYSIEYDLEYGKDVIEIQKSSLPKGSKCLVVDDLIATGGTMAASKGLIESSGSHAVAFASIIELKDLRGQEKLGGVPLVRLFSY